MRQYNIHIQEILNKAKSMEKGYYLKNQLVYLIRKEKPKHKKNMKAHGSKIDFNKKSL